MEARAIELDEIYLKKGAESDLALVSDIICRGTRLRRYGSKSKYQGGGKINGH